jgi:hypothetical protein
MPRQGIVMGLWGMAVLLAGCMRAQATKPPDWEGDRSIAFPSFHAETAVPVGADTRAYVLNGGLLRALQVAMDDFLPPVARDASTCWKTPEAYRLRVIRQDDIFFVLIHENPDACGTQFIGVDTGARYAVGLDGEILRRSVGAEPEPPPASDVMDAGAEPAPPAPQVTPSTTPTLAPGPPPRR